MNRALPMTDVYSAGVVLLLQTRSDRGRSITVQIEHVFLPFTKSQTMRILVLDGLPELEGMAAILKLYDRRFIDDRRFDDNPWSIERERAAQARWKAIREDNLVDDFDHLQEDDYSESHEEEAHRRLVKARFTHEREAYCRLVSLQGSSIPKYFGDVILPNPKFDTPEAQVDGLILEFIDGIPLSSFDSSHLSHRKLATLGNSLMVAISTLPGLGVIHSDIRSDNILICPNLSRAALIDFGETRLRKEDESDAEWYEIVAEEEMEEALRRILHRRGVRDRSPSPMPTQAIEVEHFNRTVEAESERWRNRWYERVEAGQGQPIWTLRSNVKAWLASRPTPPGAFHERRPGTPTEER